MTDKEWDYHVARGRKAAVRQGKPTASPAQREIVARILAAHLAETASASSRPRRRAHKT
jgi:hypothetical protein